MYVCVVTFICLVHLVEKLLSLSFELWVPMFIRMVEHAQPPI